jgi:hypothetical protein
MNPPVSHPALEDVHVVRADDLSDQMPEGRMDGGSRHA